MPTLEEHDLDPGSEEWNSKGSPANLQAMREAARRVLTQHGREDLIPGVDGLIDEVQKRMASIVVYEGLGEMDMRSKLKKLIFGE